MRTKTLSGAVYTGIAWLPFLALAVAVVWVLCTGLLALEVRSYGTEYFIGNHETTNRLEEIGGRSTAEDLQAALDSGDTARMAAALDRAERAAAQDGQAMANVGR